MDSSTKVDDYFYADKKTRKFTRPFEFIVFGLTALFIFIIVWNLLSRLTPIAAQRSANIFRIIINFFKKPEEGLTKLIVLPRFLYFYVTFFTLIIVIVGMLILLEALNISIGDIDFKITEFIF